VLLFEVVLNATSMFNHANVAMPAALDRVAALAGGDARHAPGAPFHPAARDRQQLWFNLPWWDRLFGTYRVAPQAGHDGMTIGLPIFRDPGELRLDRLLTQPFRDDAAGMGGQGDQHPVR